jgi:hypothetical protein
VTVRTGFEKGSDINAAKASVSLSDDDEVGVAPQCFTQTASNRCTIALNRFRYNMRSGLPRNLGGPIGAVVVYNDNVVNLGRVKVPRRVADAFGLVVGRDNDANALAIEH